MLVNKVDQNFIYTCKKWQLALVSLDVVRPASYLRQLGYVVPGVCMSVCHVCMYVSNFFTFKKMKK